MDTSLRLVDQTLHESLQEALERTLSSTRSPLLDLPRLTSVALSDPYLVEQLQHLHTAAEVRPPAAGGHPLNRLRTRLAWWLCGREIQQVNRTQASLVRTLDSLLVHLDHERTTRRRLETHLAALHEELASNQQPHGNAVAPPSNAPAQQNLTAPMHLVWHGSFAQFTGYSNSARAFVIGLDQQGVLVRPYFLYGADHDEQVMMEALHPRLRQLQAMPLRLDVPQVVYAPGDRFAKNSGRYRIGFTMLETDRLPATWVEQANQMDEVWTPTEWGVDVFRQSGVQRPIFVIPLGVDSRFFHPWPARSHLRQHTVFVSVFEWSTRKHYQGLIQAYRDAFGPNDAVLLVLKIDSRNPAANPVHELASLLPHPSPPVALIYNQAYDQSQLAELYQLADCFVLPSRGEGWGMPVLEAMACGVPAITTNWSGVTTFLNEHNGYPLPIKGLVPTRSKAPYYRDAQWAEPDQAALVDLLRSVAAQPAERQRKGKQAARDAREWPWQRGVTAIYERLTAIGV